MARASVNGGEVAIYEQRGRVRLEAELSGREKSVVSVGGEGRGR